MTDSVRNRRGALGVFLDLAERSPEAPFVSVDGKTLDRAGFLRETAAVAGALLERGVREGDRVVLMTPNRLEWCTTFWASVAIGAVPAPLDPATGIWELRNLLPVLAPRLAVATSSFRAGDPSDRIRQAMPECPVATLDGSPPWALPWDEFLGSAVPARIGGHAPNVEQPLLLACTSGTTGNPKILAVPHLGFLKSQTDMAGFMGFTPDDKVLLGMPLFHQGGFGMGLQALVAGAEAMYVRSFGPLSFLEQLASSRATVAQLSPTLAKLVLSVPDFPQRDLSSWKTVYFAGELLSDDLASRFWKDRSLRTVNVVGSSETGTMLAWDSRTDSDVSASDLSTLPFTRARILDANGDPVPDGAPGILWISTDAVLTRYEGNPDLTENDLRTEDGIRWFRTGDLARRLPDGRVRYLGRAKRIAKRGPNLVHPEEIESFLLCHPGVAAVAVETVPNDVFGESLVAWIQPAVGAELDRAAMTGFCRDRISSYKIPDQFRFVDELPADIGKIQHRRLRERRSQA